MSSETPSFPADVKQPKDPSPDEGGNSSPDSPQSSSEQDSPANGAAEPEEARDPVAPAAPEAGKQTPQAAASEPPAMVPGQPQPGGVDDDDDEDFIEEELFDEHAAPAAAQEAEEPGILTGVVVSTRHDGVFVDIGRKSEAFLPMGNRRGESPKSDLKAGDKVEVSITGQSPEGYLLLGAVTGRRPADWSHLEAAYANGEIIVGKVTELIKGGLSVDVGARAFLPASRSGARDAEELEQLVGQEIRCRIAQLEMETHNVVVDRRGVLEEQRDRQREQTIAGLEPGMVVRGVVRNIQKFGAFVDLGGVDALLHISDLSWGRVRNVIDVVAEGQEVEVQVLKIEEGGNRISVGLKQLTPDPWVQATEKLSVGDRIRGRVTRLKDFGAFVEIEPGVEGLVHISEMSWARRVRHPSDLLKVDDVIDAVVLDVKPQERRIALGVKQALGDPWDRVETECPPGSVVTGTVQKLARFGAFIEVLEGVEGLLHVSDITSEKRLNHPSEALQEGQQVRVTVLELDRVKKRLKLGMKQLEPTAQDQFLTEVQPGDTVTGRVVKIGGGEATVELGEGVQGVCRSLAAPETESPASGAIQGKDLGSMSDMLKAAWSGAGEPRAGAEPSSGALQAGQVRSFKVASLDRDSGRIELIPA